jgi:hypothetical protein
LHRLCLWSDRLRFGLRRGGLRSGALLALEVSPHRHVRRAERTYGTGGRGFFFRLCWSLGHHRLGFLPRRFFLSPSGPLGHLPTSGEDKFRLLRLGLRRQWLCFFGHLPTSGEDKFWLFGHSLWLGLDFRRQWLCFFGPSGPLGHLPTRGEDKFWLRLGLGQVGECLRLDDRRFGRDRLGDLRLDDLGFKKQAGRLLGLLDRGLRLGHLGSGHELGLGLRLARRRCLFHDLRLCNLLGFRQRLHLLD